jgi:hypothetical protein
LVEERDIWGEITHLPAPCPEHAALINHLHKMQHIARNLREHLCVLDTWAQEICRLNSVYDKDDLLAYRAMLAELSQNLLAAMAPYR